MWIKESKGAPVTETPAAEPRKHSHRTLAAILGIAVIGAGSGVGAYAVVDASHPSTPAAAAAVSGSSSPVALRTGASLISLYKKTAPGVVDITVTTTSSDQSFGFGQQSSGTAKAEGTGFVLDSKGDIVTNEHVIDGATAISVKFQNGKTTKGTLVGSDKNNDLAVIKVDPSAAKLVPLTLANSSSVQTGESVFAIGSPFGLTESLSAGIVSATGRQIDSPGNTQIANAIQTDAAINHGNSGGPLLNASGNVIGINAQIESSSDNGGNEGVGFAIPANTVKTVTASLISGQKIAHPYLGVKIEDAAGGGAQISTIEASSPAATAGLKTGDVVTQLDSTPITSSSDLVNAVSALAPGAQVTLQITRDGTQQTVQLTVGSQSA
jgi:putative serine protease PepD